MLPLRMLNDYASVV